MATNNPIDSLDPIQVALGGTGDATLTSKGVLYGNGTSPIGATSVGTAGQLLTSNGASAPTFQTATPGGVGALTLLHQLTASNSANLFFGSTYITTTYDTYLFVISNIIPATNTATFRMQASEDNGSTYLNTGASGGDSGYTFCYPYNSTTITTHFGPGSVNYNIISGPISNSNASLGYSAYIWMQSITYHKSTLSQSDYGTGQATYNDSTAGLSSAMISIGWGVNVNFFTNAFNFLMSSGNISSGTITLFGLEA